MAFGESHPWRFKGNTFAPSSVFSYPLRLGSSKAEVNKSPLECQQYESALDACFHRASGFTSQPSLIPSSDADRERIRQICLDNLQRIQASCP